MKIHRKGYGILDPDFLLPKTMLNKRKLIILIKTEDLKTNIGIWT